jgi:hypothetical protein
MKDTTKPIRDLMPEGYTRLIISELGRGSASNICEVVMTEKTTSKYWPAVEKLAMQTDSRAYRARLKYLTAKRQALPVV